MADSARLVTDKTKTESATYKILKEYPSQVKVIWTRVQPTFEDFWNQTLNFIDQMEDNSIQRDDSQPEIYDIEDDGGEPSDDF